MATHDCEYIFVRGEKKGTQCEVKLPIDKQYCKSHERQMIKSGKIVKPSSKKPKVTKAPLEPTTVVKDSSGATVLKLPLDRSESNVPLPTASSNAPILDEMKKRDNSSDSAEEAPKKKVVEFSSFEESDVPDGPETNESSADKEPNEVKVKPRKVPDAPTDEPVDHIMNTENKEEFKKELRIKEYYTKWPRLAKEMPIEKRGDISSDEWLKMIEQHMSGALFDGLLVQGVSMTCTIVEVMGPKLGLKTQGYRDTVMSLPDLGETLSLIRMRHQDELIEMTPEMKLMGSMVMVLFAVHEVNTHGIRGSPGGISHPPARREPTFKE